MNNIFKIKIALAILFLLYATGIMTFFFLFPVQKRFDIAGNNPQGGGLSQKLFDIIIVQHPQYSEAYFEKSIPYNKRGDYAKGFTLLNEAVRIDTVTYLGYRGWLKLKKLKDYEGCIEDLKRLDIMTPGFVDAPWGENIHYLLGLSYKGLKKYDLALEEFNTYIASEKDSSWTDPNVFLHKAMVLKSIDSTGTALKNLESCLKYNENAPEAYYYKGIIYKERGAFKKALECFNTALKLYKKGFKSRDIYNEVQNELYAADIEEQLAMIEKNTQ